MHEGAAKVYPETLDAKLLHYDLWVDLYSMQCAVCDSNGVVRQRRSRVVELHSPVLSFSCAALLLFFNGDIHGYASECCKCFEPAWYSDINK